MTKDELRVRVAELCGWKVDSPDDKHDARITQPNGERHLKRWELMSFGEDPNSTHEWCDRWADGSYFPDYPNDLNACAKFEKTLTTEEQQRAYVASLVGLRWDEAWSFTDAAKAVCAPAEQRCRAFVAVMEGTK